jgi:hypothetical protein
VAAVHFNPLGLIEFFVALLVVGGWGVLELVTLRMDKRRKKEADPAAEDGDPPPPAA